MNTNEMSINEFMAEVLQKGLEAVSQNEKQVKKESEQTITQAVKRTFVDPLALKTSVDGMKGRMSESLKTEKYRKKMATTTCCDMLLGQTLEYDYVQAAVTALKEIILCNIRQHLKLYLNHLIGEEEMELRKEKLQTPLSPRDYATTPAGEVGAVLKQKTNVA